MTGVFIRNGGFDPVLKPTRSSPERFFTINRDGAILFFAKICRIPALTIPIIEHFFKL